MNDSNCCLERSAVFSQQFGEPSVVMRRRVIHFWRLEKSRLAILKNYAASILEIR